MRALSPLTWILMVSIPIASCSSDGDQGSTAPADLQVVGIKSQAHLSWSAASDGTPPAAYRVYRDDVEIAEVTSTSFVDQLPDDEECVTRQYRVLAVDAAGNESPSTEPAESSLPLRNVILMIGDGMGPEHELAAGCYLFGPTHGTSGNQLVFETLPVQGQMTTQSANSEITDSAAAATAMATGHKVANTVVSMANPGDERDLYTLLECFADQGRATGMVTTTQMTHATPACFGAHQPVRYLQDEIASDYLEESRPNLLFGGATYMTPELATDAGYEVATTRAELGALPGDTEFVSGQFAPSHLPYEYDASQADADPYEVIPHLHEMVSDALGRLEDHPEGFFLLVEGGRIDHAGHENNIGRNVLETVAFDEAVEAVLSWADGRDDTLVVVTADHETGGLDLVECTSAGVLPTVTWSTPDHTGVPVNTHAWGKNSERFGGTIDNTDFFTAITSGP
ncbi:MAG: alkaline phosphatase [Polyangiales bacterium]